MNINGIGGNGSSAQPFQMRMNQSTDAIGRNLQNQITNAQKQLQDLGENKDISPEDKMKKRQEIQQQISDLQNQLRQHQIEQRMKEQQKSSSSMKEMLGASERSSGRKKGSSGLSGAGMQAIISADSSMKQVKIQGAVRSQMEGKAGVLKSEIKLDEARGGDASKKKEELEQMEERAQDITTSQMEIISDTKKKLEEAAKADQEASKTEKTGKKDKTDEKGKTETEGKQREAVPEDAKTSVVSKEEPIGNNVDVKL